MDFLKQLKNIPWFKPDWVYPNVTEETKEFLSKCTDLPPASLGEDLGEIIKKSKAFPIKFPIDTVRLHQLQLRRPIERLKRNIVSTYPIIHERVLILMIRFLTYKKEFGSNIEKDFYKDMTVPEFIERILTKRAISFYGPRDKYLLLTGEKGMSGWELIGSSEQKPLLLLENCLSYDELKLSALVYVSGYTDCINDGTRKNSGVLKEDNIEQNAVMIGLIGPRLKRRSKMDYQEILVTKEQNIDDHGYGDAANRPHQVAKHLWRKMWCDFYEIENVTYDKVTSLLQKQNRNETRPYIQRYHHKKTSKLIFDNEVYYKRISVLAESTLLEAEYRAVESGKLAFVNVVGCGLGVWMVQPHQVDVYVLTFLERIHALLHKDLLNHVSDVNFSYIKASPEVEGIFTKDTTQKEPELIKLFLEYKGHPKGGLNVQMQKREPSSKLSGEHEGKLLVMTYPWDSNAHPGNEFWCGLLASTGDSAAASSTQITELHNAYINPAVSANNVRVVGRHGLKTLSEYCLALTTSD
ncbi:uncharacterized protein [Maniola hyperantus]|uniref:uncharacterized protein isoform X1 n=2 Tax=Aphantopus hyperantus TaxID=2795564 RepID=UPI001569A554|nr:uncharacterized protein LOC117983560 isoform X1 [Maniola hyperantus]